MGERFEKIVGASNYEIRALQQIRDELHQLNETLERLEQFAENNLVNLRENDDRP